LHASALAKGSTPAAAIARMENLTMFEAWVILVVFVVVVVVDDDGGDDDDDGVLVTACHVVLLMGIAPPLYSLDSSTLNSSRIILPPSIRSSPCANAFAVTEPRHTEVPSPT
jgi:hypothetical protein